MCGSGKIMIMTPLIKYYKKEKKVEGKGLEKLRSERQREKHRETLRI